ncbi:hypothetical protein cyc_04815 [Cyclospora cayetanensis]|uniref:Thrombospondin type 1 domain-containing protein n=1 Tax=Cyclospora cayetanensis TaxID=88456 RepID=A0A1D3CW64_9EIME|nr:hypothetical protein cyc_04815 [Cyclospora cayetanensis]
MVCPALPRRARDISRWVLLLLKVAEYYSSQLSYAYPESYHPVHSIGNPTSLINLNIHSEQASRVFTEGATCTPWSEWSTCSTLCGGKRVRFRITGADVCDDGLGVMDEEPCPAICKGMPFRVYVSYLTCATPLVSTVANGAAGLLVLLNVEGVRDEERGLQRVVNVPFYRKTWNAIRSHARHPSEAQVNSISKRQSLQQLRNSCDAFPSFATKWAAYPFQGTDKLSAEASQSCTRLYHVWEEACSPTFCESLEDMEYESEEVAGPEIATPEESTEGESESNNNTLIAGCLVGGVALFALAVGGPFAYSSGLGSSPEGDAADFDDLGIEEDVKDYESDLETIVQIEDYSFAMSS